MKKLFVCVIVLALSVLLVACGGTADTEAPETQPPETQLPETEPAETEHVHDVLVEEKLATCTERGYRIETCATCGEVVLETALPKTACTPAGEATCTEDSICTECERVVTAALGHAFGEMEYPATATCTNDGKEVRSCTVCGFVEETVIPAIPHVMGVISEEKAPNCSEAGYKKGECAMCECEIIEEIAPFHNLLCDAFYLADDGTLVANCMVCGEVIPALETRISFDFDKPLTEEVAAYAEYGLTVPKPDTAILAVNGDRTVLQPRRRVAVDFDGEMLYDARYFVISFDFYISQLVQPSDPSNPKRASVFAFVPGSANDGKASSNGMTFANFTKFTYGKGFVFSQYGTLADIENGVPVVEAVSGDWYHFMYIVDNVTGQAYIYLDGVYVANPQMEEGGFYGVNATVDETFEGYYSMFFGCDYIKEYAGQFDNFTISVIK